jgi:N6-adenosine-specific RNA methylase IME4
VSEWGTIVADPPWRYIEAGLWQRQKSQANRQYDTLTVQQIQSLPVPAADNAYLWLWITNRHLAHGVGKMVAESWGFRPITVLTWCKPQIGLGYYLRNATEHVVFAVRGSPGQLNATNISSWFVANRTRHSSKPDEFYEIVERACDGPYLDVFARKNRPGWTCWGKDVGDTLNIGFDPDKWRALTEGEE